MLLEAYSMHRGRGIYLVNPTALVFFLRISLAGFFYFRFVRPQILEPPIFKMLRFFLVSGNFSFFSGCNHFFTFFTLLTSIRVASFMRIQLLLDAISLSGLLLPAWLGPKLGWDREKLSKSFWKNGLGWKIFTCFPERERERGRESKIKGDNVREREGR